MDSNKRHITFIIATLCVLVAGELYVLLTKSNNALPDVLPNGTAVLKASRISTTEAETVAFFQKGATEFRASPGLFETQFFKPVPPPPAPPPPPPPTEKNVAVKYRGRAIFADGTVVIYFNIGDSPVELAIGDTVVAPWKLTFADDTTARFSRDEKNSEVAFNDTVQLSVPAK